MADKRRGRIFHMSSSSSHSSSEGNDEHHIHKEEIVVIEEHEHEDECDTHDEEDEEKEEEEEEEEEDDEDEDEEEDDQFGLEEIGMGEFIPLMKEFKVLDRKIRNLDTSLKNPLYRVAQDIEHLGCMILELKEEYGANVDIVTAAMRNGIRHESRSQVEQLSKNHPVAKVNPNPRKGKFSKAIDKLIEIVVNLYYPNIERSKKLLGNFRPVREETREGTTPVEAFVVKGQIPKTIKGMMIRNGPDAVHEPPAHYYWMDGDSMIHAIYFENGKATYVSRYVRTSRFKQEDYHKKSQFLQYGDLHGAFGLFMACMQLLREKLGVLDMSYGWSNAHTGVVYHNMLMILQDWDHPYAIKVHENKDLSTLGINNYNKGLGHSLNPHPKKDPITGELFILGSSITPPYASFSIVSKEGDISDPLPIKTVLGPTYMHDFGLTKNYIICMDLPYCYDPKKMLSQGTWIYSFQKKKSRFGVLPRYAESEEGIVWFEFDETYFIFHNGNSWEEDEDTIVLISVVIEPKTTVSKESAKAQVDPANRDDDILSNVDVDEARNIYEFFFNPQHLFGGRNSDMGYTPSKLCKLTFNMRTGERKIKKLLDGPFEYPKVNENYIARKSKYVYVNGMTADTKMSSIVKYNLEWESEIRLNFGEKKYGSEVAFVPRLSHTWLEEDDGYLTTFMHDEGNDTSFAYVISAQRMEILAMINLPSRVPYGFHATFVTEEECQQLNRY